MMNNEVTTKFFVLFVKKKKNNELSYKNSIITSSTQMAFQTVQVTPQQPQMQTVQMVRSK